MVKDRHNCRERDRDKDTDRAEQFAADDDRDQGDHRRDTERVTEEVRLYDITVDRLQDACEDDECHRIHRVFQHKHEGTHDAADDRSEGRQDIRKSDDHRDKNDVRKTGDQHEDRIGNTDTDGLEDSKADVLGEDGITSFQKIGMSLILIISKCGTAELVDPAEESFLAGDKIDRQDQSDKDIQGDIPDPAENIHRHVQVVGNIGDHDLRLFLQICRPVRRIQVDTVILGEFVEVLQLIFYVRRIVLRIIHKVCNTADHLRKDQPEEQSESQKYDGDRYDD